MAVWGTKIIWSFMLMLAGAAGQRVNYPDATCAIKGSTVTLPCSFTPLQSVVRDGREVMVEIVRVRWCRNHLICHSTTPSVYDSNSPDSDPRYRYLGDKTGNCTLEITDVQKADEGILRFRMEANDSTGHFTGRPGVEVNVSDDTRLRIDSSRGDGDAAAGGNVTLLCTARCTFHQLDVTWLRDGHALSESGPALQLGPLTAEDSGNYTCSLKSRAGSPSPPYSLQVEADRTGLTTSELPSDYMVAVRLLFFSVHTLLIVIVTIVIIKRAWWRKTDSREMNEVVMQIVPPEM